MQFGPWQFDKNSMDLVHPVGRYTVYLDRLNSSAEILDVISQVHQKTWADADTLKGLLDAIEAVLQPQSNFCSMGIERGSPGKGEQLAKRFASRP